MQQPGKTQKLIIFLVIFLIIAFVVMQFVWTSSSTKNGSAGQLSNIKSASGQFALSASPDTTPIPMNKIHAWTVQIVDTAGKPLENASIEVNGGMPAHGHALPTHPQMTRVLGGGKYLIEGFRFQMPGVWVINFHITAENIDDTATVQFTLQ